MKALLLTAFLSVAFISPVMAEQTVLEKTEVKAKDAKRAIKKGYNRVEEKVCMKDDMKCLEQKAKHRANEAKDATVDKADEVKDRVD